MKKFSTSIGQFKNILAEREEFLMCRQKHVEKIQITETYSSKNPSEQIDWIEFPISADVILCRRYEDADKRNFRISRVKNGKELIICEKSNYNYCLTDDEFKNFFDEFDSCVKSFRKKGYIIVVA